MQFHHGLIEDLAVNECLYKGLEEVLLTIALYCQIQEYRVHKILWMTKEYFLTPVCKSNISLPFLTIHLIIRFCYLLFHASVTVSFTFNSVMLKNIDIVFLWCCVLLPYL